MAASISHQASRPASLRSSTNNSSTILQRRSSYTPAGNPETAPDLHPPAANGDNTNTSNTNSDTETLLSPPAASTTTVSTSKYRTSSIFPDQLPSGPPSAPSRPAPARPVSQLAPAPPTPSFSLSRNQKPPGLFALAAAAIDKTFANRSEPTVRSRPSSRTLRRLSVALDSPASPDPNRLDGPQRVLSPASSISSTPALSSPGLDTKRSTQSLQDPISKPYSETDPTCPPPVLVSADESKMHQTSSRLLRMTDDDRPFTKVSRSSSSVSL